MSVPAVELPQILQIEISGESFFLPEKEIFIKLPSCTKTALVQLDMKVRDFLGIISTISGIPIQDMMAPKRCFRVVCAGKDLTEDVNVTLSSFGIKKYSTIHVVGILRGCVIWEHYAKERDLTHLESCVRDLDTDIIIKALDEYGVNHTYITSEAGLKELLMNYAWAHFLSYD
jgi:hypothetical protein